MIYLVYGYNRESKSTRINTTGNRMQAGKYIEELLNMRFSRVDLYLLPAERDAILLEHYDDGEYSYEKQFQKVHKRL